MANYNPKNSTGNLQRLNQMGSNKITNNHSRQSEQHFCQSVQKSILQIKDQIKGQLQYIIYIDVLYIIFDLPNLQSSCIIDLLDFPVNTNNIIML